MVIIKSLLEITQFWVGQEKSTHKNQATCKYYQKTGLC